MRNLTISLFAIASLGLAACSSESTDETKTAGQDVTNTHETANELPDFEKGAIAADEIKNLPQIVELNPALGDLEVSLDKTADTSASDEATH